MMGVREMLRSAWFIAQKDISYTLRERSAVIWLFLMPLVFFYFIGTVTSGFSGGNPNKPDTLAVWTPGDAGFLAEQLKLRLRQNNFRLVEFPHQGSETERGFDDYRRRLAIPGHFTDTVLAGDAVEVEYRGEEADLGQDYDVVRVNRAVYTVLADIVVAGDNNDQVDEAAIESLNRVPRTMTLAVRPAGERLEIPSGFEQAIPGIMVMFTLLVLLTNGAVSLFNERQNGLLRRLAATPISRPGVVLGKWGGKMALGLVQIAFAMVAGSLIFGMRWGQDFLFVILLMFSWGAFCASFGLLLGSIGKTEGQVSGLGVLASMGLAALGGCWWPIEITPPVLQALQKFLPSGWAMDGMHKLVSFGAGPGSVVANIAALLAGALLLGWIAQKKFRFQ